MIDREDGRRIDHLGTEVAQLHRLDEREFRYDVRRVDDPRVGSHETIHVGPYFQQFGVQGSGNDSGGIVRSASTQVGHFARLAVARYETAHDGDARVAREVAYDVRVGGLEVTHVLVEHLDGLDKFAAIYPLGIGDDLRHDAAGDALAVTHHGTERLGRQLADEEDATIDVVQFLEGLADEEFDIRQGLSVQQTIHHIIVALADELKVLRVGLIARGGFVGCSDEPVGDTTQGRNDHDDRFLTFFYNLLDILDACNGAHRRATEFQYVHILNGCFMLEGFVLGRGAIALYYGYNSPRFSPISPQR